MFVSYLPLFKHFLFSNKYEPKDKRTFCLPSFHDSCRSISSSNYHVFSHQRRRLVFDIDYAPGGRWEPSKWHFNRLSSLSVWICVKLTPARAELDTTNGSLSSLVRLIASVSPGWCRISVFSDLCFQSDRRVRHSTREWATVAICFSTYFKVKTRWKSKLWLAAHWKTH